SKRTWRERSCRTLVEADRTVISGCLTVKLRGRASAPDWSRGRMISPRARGETTEPHGTLQRLLDDIGTVFKQCGPGQDQGRRESPAAAIRCRDPPSSDRAATEVVSVRQGSAHEQ